MDTIRSYSKREDILNKLILKIDQLRNNVINDQTDNLMRSIYSEVYINWSFILYDLIKNKLHKIIEILEIEDQSLESENINYYKINNPYINNNLDKLLNDILDKTNSDNSNDIMENSPELCCFIHSEKFIESQKQLNNKIKNILLDEFLSDS